MNIETMSRIIFTSEQIKKLSQNKNVARAGNKSVRYTRSFKDEALRQYHEEGLSAVGIFEEAGFDLNLIGKRTPNRLMNQWGTACKQININTSASPPERRIGLTIKRIESKREMKNLRAKVAYLQAANDFLAKFRARKRK